MCHRHCPFAGLTREPFTRPTHDIGCVCPADHFGQAHAVLQRARFDLYMPLAERGDLAQHLPIGCEGSFKCRLLGGFLKRLWDSVLAHVGVKTFRSGFGEQTVQRHLLSAAERGADQQVSVPEATQCARGKVAQFSVVVPHTASAGPPAAPGADRSWPDRRRSRSTGSPPLSRASAVPLHGDRSLWSVPSVGRHGWHP